MPDGKKLSAWRGGLISACTLKQRWRGHRRDSRPGGQRYGPGMAQNRSHRVIPSPGYLSPLVPSPLAPSPSHRTRRCHGNRHRSRSHGRPYQFRRPDIECQTPRVVQHRRAIRELDAD